MATKQEVKHVASELTKKAQSWGQVCKQLSGIKGKIALGTGEKAKKVSVKEAFALLGVKVAKTTITPKLVAAAWAEQLKKSRPMHDGGDECARTFSGWRCPLIVKAIPVVAEVLLRGEKTTYRLYTKDSKTGEYSPVTALKKCRLVKAEDRRKGSTDCIVSAQLVLRGLYQSVYVTDTLKEMAASEKAAKEIDRAWVNVGKATAPKWHEVEISATDGKWHFVAIPE